MLNLHRVGQENDPPLVHSVPRSPCSPFMQTEHRNAAGPAGGKPKHSDRVPLGSLVDRLQKSDRREPFITAPYLPAAGGNVKPIPGVMPLCRRDAVFVQQGGIDAGMLRAVTRKSAGSHPKRCPPLFPSCSASYCRPFGHSRAGRGGRW